MPKITFLCQHIDPFPWKEERELARVTYESSRESLEDIIADFEDFLRGCGFNFAGNIGIIDDEIEITPMDSTQHNDYYYDINRNR